MRFVKVLILLVFFFVCMLFFVQNTTTLEAPLVLKLSAFGFSAETPGAPFYVVLLLAFVVGGLFASIYFLCEKIRLSAQIRKLNGKVKSLEQQLASVASAAMPMSGFTASTTSAGTPAAGSADESDEHQGA